MDMIGTFWSIFSLLFYVAPLVFVVYMALQFLKETRQRNDLLYQILEELRQRKS